MSKPQWYIIETVNSGMAKETGVPKTTKIEGKHINAKQKLTAFSYTNKHASAENSSLRHLKT